MVAQQPREVNYLKLGHSVCNFQPNAGPPGLGYYAYDFGGWRIYALNS
jgi:hypothetical protein